MWNFFYIEPLIKHNRMAEFGKEVGLWLREHVFSDSVIATNTAGSIPYYSGLTTIDMLGITDLHIAHRPVSNLGSGFAGHEKSDAEYILSRKPDLIQFGSSYGARTPVFRSDFELYDNPQFFEHYGLKEIAMPSGNILWDIRLP